MQEHLLAQDKALDSIIRRMERLEAKLERGGEVSR
jgi:hypothetical protein